MTSVSRRLVLGGATIPFAAWMAQQQAWAGPAARVRRDLSTAAAAADLKKYADAVKMMMAKGDGDPRGWVFQWYIHAVRSDRGKAAELARVFPAPSADKTLAMASWSTCQAHTAGTVEDYFLPWHRMYVFYFEAIIQKLLGDPSFALPYWHYTAPSQRSLPAHFRQPGDPTWGSLYRSARDGPVNAGTAIDAGAPGAITTVSLNQTSYSPLAAQPGFCSQIDGDLHGNVHVLVGNGSTGMGAIPWAANDPIFWMHHCNIDRMWASWNAHGGCNPSSKSWLDHTFTFPDGDGNSIVGKISDFAALGPLNYSYDALEPGPKVGKCNQLFFNLGALRNIYLYPEPFPIDPIGPVERTLVLPPQTEIQRSDPRLLAAIGGGRLRLVLDQLQAPEQPGVLYEVYLKRQANDQPQSLGVINFFDHVASEHADHQMADMRDMPQPVKFYSFDVTDLVQGLKAPPTIGFRPLGKPEREVKAVVGSIRVVEG
jgi:hypothetical protein